MKRVWFTPGIVVWILSLIFAATTALAQAEREVLVLAADGPVSPAMLNYIERGLEIARNQGVEAVIIELDTPGGQIDWSQSIVQAIVNSDVPVVVYIYPSGSYAASAGTFITLAGHVAAMAPQTSIGAASPVDGSGGDIEPTMRSKIENILLADIENLAERRGEKVVEWAKEAVLDAKAANTSQALEIGLIDFIAKNPRDLLEQMDGFEVTVQGERQILQTADAQLRPLEKTLLERLLATLLTPEVAFLLLTIGPLAIIYELVQPGGFVSGVIGVIALILGLYAIGQLPVNWAGLGLMILAFVLFVADIFAPTHGALTAAGVISLFLGGLFLFDAAELDYRISIAPVAAVSVSMGLIFFFMIGTAVLSLHRKPVTGAEGLIGTIGVAKTELAPKGVVFVDGARWQASTEGDDEIKSGDQVEVIAREGLNLKVRKKA